MGEGMTLGEARTVWATPHTQVLVDSLYYCSDTSSTKPGEQLMGNEGSVWVAHSLIDMDGE